MLIGTTGCYLFSTAWLAYPAGLGFCAALAAGVIPFISGDIVKIAIVLTAAPVFLKRLQAAEVL